MCGAVPPAPCTPTAPQTVANPAVRIDQPNAEQSLNHAQNQLPAGKRPAADLHKDPLKESAGEDQRQEQERLSYEPDGVPSSCQQAQQESGWDKNHRVIKHQVGIQLSGPQPIELAHQA